MIFLFKGSDYPPHGNSEIYSRGLLFILDSFAHTNGKDVSSLRDSLRNQMYDLGKLEQTKTPLDVFNEPKLFIHNKNEIPLFLGPSQKFITIDGHYGNSVGEVKIPLKVLLVLSCNL